MSVSKVVRLRHLTNSTSSQESMTDAKKDGGGASATFVDGNHVDVCSVEGIIPVILGRRGGVGMMNHE